jgi:hypothetical protein
MQSRGARRFVDGFGGLENANRNALLGKRESRDDANRTAAGDQYGFCCHCPFLISA